MKNIGKNVFRNIYTNIKHNTKKKISKNRFENYIFNRYKILHQKIIYLLPKKFIVAVVIIVNICEIRGSINANSVSKKRTAMPVDKLITSKTINEKN